MNLPTKLTVLRLILSLVLVGLLCFPFHAFGLTFPVFDFYGVQVRSFEEAQKYPYCCEKPLFLLDAQNEKVYIKKMENGIPSVVTYEMKEIKENSIPKEEKQEQVPQIDFSAEFQKIREELKQDMEKQFQELKMTHENEIKNNKKW